MMILTEETVVNEDQPEVYSDQYKLLPRERLDDVLLPLAAAAYLARLYGRPFTTADFKNLRANHSEKIAELGIDPVDRSASITQWYRRDLFTIAEAIPSPRYSEVRRQPRAKRKPRKSED